MRTLFSGLFSGLPSLALVAPLLAQDPQLAEDLLPAQDPATSVQTTQPIFTEPAPDGEVHGLAADLFPGGHAGMERWIVHFKSRSFDLSAFRAAIHDRRPAGEVALVVEELEEDVVADQAAFVVAVEKVLGGHVFARWWLINACAIQIPFKDLPKVRALPNVDRLEPDRLWHSWIKTSTNSSNHNSDFVQNVLKVDGSGVTVAILDTGQNSDVGSGRPHRTYYLGGNPSNTSGSGIGGSRLVVNRQIGFLSANDPVGHGTGVGSIAAGANWGTSGADNGHAFGANVAGYSISNTSSGSSSSSTMVSAWQAAAKDRATYNIVAANLSFGGSPDPREAAQLALDSAALNADILPCVAAGNSSTSTSASQGAANGLAVGAISPNTHTVASFSSRGPLYDGRFYPDIAGLGVNTVMARARNEGSDLSGSGTSMASPQVCGVAGLVRAANRQLTALQTKAILLATTQNIQQANPNLDRNSFGTGMLRADLAVSLALSKAGFGTGTLTTTSRTQRITLNVVQGKQYAVVVTWYRTVLSSSSASYSNLDFKVLDGATPVAESKTPLNLYEHASFLARKSGTFTLEVSSPSLSGSSQTFAYAFTEAPKSPIPGVVSSFGQGCLGNGTPVGGTCMSDNTNQSFRLSTGYPGVTYALEIVATSNLNVEGWEMMSASGLTSPQTVSTLLYDTNSSGQPNSVLATGTMQIGPSVGWYRSTFNKKVQIQKGQRFFLAFVNPSPYTTRLGITSAGNITPYWRNNGSGGSWIRFTTRPWAWKVLCAATSGGAVPEAGANGEPAIGGPVTLTLRRALGNTNSILVVGVSNTQGFGTSLPFNLATLGAPNCSLYVSGDVLVTARTDSLGSLDLRFTIPNDKTLIGASVFNQFAVQDQAANNLGYAFSNALALVVGGTP